MKKFRFKESDPNKVFKEYKEFLQEQFMTTYGLLNFFIITVIWYAIVVRYVLWFHESLLNYFVSALGVNLLSEYLTYLSLGIVFALIGLALRWALLQILLGWYNNRRR